MILYPYVTSRWGNDGMQELKMLVARDGSSFMTPPASNGREPFVSQGLNSCTELSSWGWCEEGKSWQNIPFDAAQLYFAAGLVVQHSEILMYYNGMPMPHGRFS